MSESANLTNRLDFVENGVLAMQIDWNPDALSPGPYQLTTKWCKFSLKMRLHSSVVWEVSEGAHITFDQTGDNEIVDELRPWIDAEYPEAAAPKNRFHGVCPDLTLYDLQVLDENGGDEFAVLAALQFVRHLNSGKDNPLIHGVNLSLSIRHDVANFACGRTPVCDECERVVGSSINGRIGEGPIR